MSNYTNITAENVDDFPMGTKVRFHWGCPVDTGGGDFDGPQEEDGLVVGWASKPATKWSEEKIVLLVDTETGRQMEVSKFCTVGVGCYLVGENTQ